MYIGIYGKIYIGDLGEIQSALKSSPRNKKILYTFLWGF